MRSQRDTSFAYGATLRPGGNSSVSSRMPSRGRAGKQEMGDSRMKNKSMTVTALMA